MAPDSRELQAIEIWQTWVLGANLGSSAWTAALLPTRHLSYPDALTFTLQTCRYFLVFFFLFFSSFILWHTQKREYLRDLRCEVVIIYANLSLCFWLKLNFPNYFIFPKAELGRASLQHRTAKHCKLPVSSLALRSGRLTFHSSFSLVHHVCLWKAVMKQLKDNEPETNPSI